MEDTRFDTVAKALGSLASRRLTLGALLGGALGRLGLEDAAARRTSGKCTPKCDQCEKCDKGKCEKKNGKKVCKKGKCKPKTTGTPCTVPAGGSCQSGVCVCTGGTTNCGGVCSNQQTDEANCGACGTVCSANQVCQAGSCFPRSTCPATTTTACVSGPTGTPCGLGCYCSVSTEGNVVCYQNEAFCSASGTCTTSANCPAGEACVEIGGCCLPALPAGTKVCVARCVDPTAAVAAARDGGRPGE